MVGQRIASYEITARLGEGGMGEVYRARDTKLGREVALKILPPAFAEDRDRLARFQREARVLAALNHPHIAAIYGLEDDTDIHALVMELVEGHTLAERLQRGPLPLAEAIAIARQIADALEAAHENGIIHRDLKPSNVKVTPAGTVKVLDFGLAKTLEPVTGADEAEAPTATALGTRVGVALGTPAYMSPEQARGEAVDKRTDVWAFGCALYELLTGRRAFAGKTVSDTIAAVLEREPDWSRLPPSTPAAVRRVLRRCLEKDPRTRLRDIGDTRFDLDEARAAPLDAGEAVAPDRRRVTAILIAASLALTAIALGVIAWNLKGSAEPPAVSRFVHLPPEDQSFSGAAFQPMVAIAPDGSALVYAAAGRLYRRTMDGLDAVPIRGTDGAPWAPFVSPDGQAVGYWDAAAQELRRIPLSGGTVVTLSRATGLYGASWEADGTILYGQVDGIWRVSANGGTPAHLVPIEAGELVYGPRLLPDGRSVMFSLLTIASMTGQATAWDTAQVVVESLDTGERTPIVRGGDARYVPTGHLLYAMGSVLFAVPFDVTRLEVRGAPVPVVEGVERGVRGRDGQGGAANYDFSRTGALVYVPAGAQFSRVARSLLAVDHEGNATPLLDEQMNYWRPKISPDGTRVAVEALDANNVAQLWIVDLDSRTASPLTGVGIESAYAVWMPDGRSVLYWRPSGGYRQSADGIGEPELLVPIGNWRTSDVSRDGVLVLNRRPEPEGLGTLRPEDDSVSEFLEVGYMAMFSPDRKWLAYASRESGQWEVYVRPYPRTPGVGRLVSVGGGMGPVWAPDGTTLYYRGASGDLMAVPTTLDPTFSAGRPRPLFRFDGVYRMSGTAAAYDIHPDGQRFIMVSEPDVPVAPSRQINIVLNWHEELKRLAPAGR
jgi:eukaryotic-like serine/threonine-protein kinase